MKIRIFVIHEVLISNTDICLFSVDQRPHFLSAKVFSRSSVCESFLHDHHIMNESDVDNRQHRTWFSVLFTFFFLIKAHFSLCPLFSHRCITDLIHLHGARVSPFLLSSFYSLSVLTQSFSSSAGLQSS